MNHKSKRPSCKAKRIFGNVLDFSQNTSASNFMMLLQIKQEFVLDTARHSGALLWSDEETNTIRSKDGDFETEGRRGPCRHPRTLYVVQGASDVPGTRRHSWYIQVERSPDDFHSCRAGPSIHGSGPLPELRYYAARFPSRSQTSTQFRTSIVVPSGATMLEASLRIPPAPAKCLSCRGVRWRVKRISTNLYACGYYTAADHCPACNGTGIQAPPAIDAKMEAAGGAA